MMINLPADVKELETDILCDRKSGSDALGFSCRCSGILSANGTELICDEESRVLIEGVAGNIA